MMNTYTATITESFTVMLHGVYKQEIYNISFDNGVRGREKLQTLGSKTFLVMIVTGK